jgi:hypothetical protein
MIVYWNTAISSLTTVLKMEVVYFSETSVYNENTTQRKTQKTTIYARFVAFCSINGPLTHGLEADDFHVCTGAMKDWQSAGNSSIRQVRMFTPL